MMRKKLYAMLLCLGLTLVLSACGGGGSTPSAAPTKVVVKLSTNGTLPTLPPLKIGGISTTINYPSGKVTISDNNVVASGNAKDGTLIPNTTTPGSVTLGNVSLANGFDVGEFATLTFTITGSAPSINEFTIVSGSTSVAGNDYPPTTLSDISVTIQSVTFQ